MRAIQNPTFQNVTMVFCDRGCFPRSDYHASLNVSVFTHLASEPSNCKWRWGGAERGRDGGAARAAWGLLGPTEGIVICNIHSNVPYQMQWVRRCLRMEISLVPPLSPGHTKGKFRQINLLRQYIWNPGDTEGCMNGRGWQKQWRSVKQRGPCLSMQTNVPWPPSLTILNNCQHFMSMQIQGDFPISF